jgi:hypothetical protein
MWCTFQPAAVDHVLSAGRQAARTLRLPVLVRRVLPLSEHHAHLALASMTARRIPPFEPATLLQAPVFDTF